MINNNYYLCDYYYYYIGRTTCGTRAVCDTLTTDGIDAHIKCVVLNKINL